MNPDRVIKLVNGNNNLLMTAQLLWYKTLPKLLNQVEILHFNNSRMKNWSMPVTMVILVCLCLNCDAKGIGGSLRGGIRNSGSGRFSFAGAGGGYNGGQLSRPIWFYILIAALILLLRECLKHICKSVVRIVEEDSSDSDEERGAEDKTESVGRNKAHNRA